MWGIESSSQHSVVCLQGTKGRLTPTSTLFLQIIMASKSSFKSAILGLEADKLPIRHNLGYLFRGFVDRSKELRKAWSFVQFIRIWRLWKVGNEEVFRDQMVDIQEIVQLVQLSS
ncbi:hypothetical protein VNO78_35032 [Psophocarpus tetragonolobus]|uniref:Uncharacterized protein n=1 Tax=Psophocarpus tetragonolobus TaxID=3891 RepID=A0AAN9NUQ8_PSOTE